MPRPGPLHFGLISERYSRLDSKRLVIGVQTPLVTIQQAGLHQRFDILMHAPVVPT